MRRALLLALLLLPARALAQSSAAPSDFSVSSTGSVQTLIAAGTIYRGGRCQNTGTATWYMSLTNSSPAAGATGTETLLPGGTYYLPSFIMQAPLYGLASAGGSELACTLLR